MFWIAIGLLVVLWIVGLLARIGGALIHLFLVVAAIVVVANMVRSSYKKR